MKELIYTKNNLEYAYFANENGVMKEITPDALSETEQKLTQCSAAGITLSAGQPEADALYFDPGYQELRTVRWQFSRERDPRGYVEARFSALSADPPALRADADGFAGEIRDVLERICEEYAGSAGLIRIRRGSLFPEDTPEAVQNAVIHLLCIMLPDMISERLIFLSQNGLQVGTVHPVPSPDGIPLFEESDMILLQLIRQCDSTDAYKTLLQYAMQSVFHLPPAPVQSDDVFSIQSVRTAADIWEKTLNPPISDLIGFFGGDSIAQMLRSLLTDRIAPLWKEPDGDLLCSQYISVMQLLEPFSQTDVFSGISDMLSLTAHKDILTPQRAFLLLNTLHYLVSDADLRLVSDVLAAPFLDIRNTAELCRTADETAPFSAEHIVSVLVNAGKQQEMAAMCRRLEQDALSALEQFEGICADAEFRALEQTLQTVSAVCQVCGMDLAEQIAVRYVSGCTNIVQCQRLAPFYLKETEPLAHLLSHFSEWRAEHFFLPLHPVFYQTLLNAVQQSELSQYECSALSALLEAYLPAASIFYELCTLSSDAEAAYTKSRKLDIAFEKLPDRLLNAVRICNSPDSVKTLRFLVNTLFSNPVSALKTADLFMQQREMHSGKKLSKLFYYDPAPTDLHTYLNEPRSGAIPFLRSLFDPEHGIVPFRKPLLKRNRDTGTKEYEQDLLRVLSRSGLSRRAECDLRTELQHASRIYSVLITQMQLSASVPAFSQCIRSL